MVLAGSLFQLVRGDSHVMVLTLSPLRFDNSTMVNGRQRRPVPVWATIRQKTGGHSLAMSSQLRRFGMFKLRYFRSEVLRVGVSRLRLVDQASDIGVQVG